MVNPKFKVGDKVVNKNSNTYSSFLITRIRSHDYNKTKTVYVCEIDGREVHFDEDELELENADSGADLSNLLVALDYSKGTKYDSGKAPIHMIPEEAILGTALAFGYGAKKYDRFNYRKGIEFTRLQDSLMRHMLAFSQGQDTDNESGLPHLYHAAANIAMLIYMNENKPEMDDRDKRKKND